MGGWEKEQICLFLFVIFKGPTLSYREKLWKEVVGIIHNHLVEGAP